MPCRDRAASRLRQGLSELRPLGRTFERRGGCAAAGDHLLHLVEVAGPDEPLMPDRGVSVARARREFPLLQAARRLSFRRARILVRQFEHAEVQRVESGQGDELELVAHRAELVLEAARWSASSSFFFQWKEGEQL